MPHSDWREEYAASIDDVEINNPVNMELVSTCSQMADRISALQAEIESLHTAQQAAAAPPSTTSTKKKSKKDQPPPVPEPSVDEDSFIARLRLELAEALRSKGVSETRLRSAQEEVDRLQTRARSNEKTIRTLELENSTLTRKLKDRDHELREKGKLIESVQDEMITINLQMSVAEAERDKVKEENKELVDRWMRRMAVEVEAMNLANAPMMHLGNGRGPSN